MKMKFLVLIQLVMCIAPILCDKDAKIVIVGAGAAGIAAASRLMENGFTNVKIIEAQDRRGGRVWTEKMGDYWIDMGGQWVHGNIDNIVYNLAAPLGLVQNHTTYGALKMNKVYGSNGAVISEENFRKILNFFVSNSENITDIESLKTRSIGEYLTKRFEGFFRTIPEMNAEQREGILFWLNRAQMASDGAFDWSDVSAKSVKDYDGIIGDNQVNWKDKGYSTILDILTKRIPNPEKELPVVNKTVLNAKVTKIKYGDDGPVKLSTADGKEYLADHVIFTCSLGVLKADHENLFTPPLPEKKVNAIKNIGFGTVAKIYLLYDKPWWKPEENFMKPMFWSREDKAKLDSNPVENWMLGVYSAITIEHKPNLLCLWMSGEYSREMEKVPEELFKTQTLGLIRKFYGQNYKIVEPKEIRRTMWNTNQHIKGSYSYRSIDSDKFEAKNEDLAEPVMRNNKPIIQFAGEATDGHRYSTVHGAVESGFREANRLIELYFN